MDSKLFIIITAAYTSTTFEQAAVWQPLVTEVVLTKGRAGSGSWGKGWGREEGQGVAQLKTICCLLVISLAYNKGNTRLQT